MERLEKGAEGRRPCRYRERLRSGWRRRRFLDDVRRQQFLPNDVDVRRRSDAEPDALSVNLHDLDDDALIDDETFADPTGENEHGNLRGAGIERTRITRITSVVQGERRDPDSILVKFPRFLTPYTRIIACVLLY